MTRILNRNWTAFAAALLFSLTGSASDVSGSEDPAYPDFIAACKTAFARSEGAQELGDSICRCTADESRHQEVTLAELRKETAAIRKDPKYKIQDKKLLAALHVCTISAMRQMESE